MMPRGSLTRRLNSVPVREAPHQRIEGVAPERNGAPGRKRLDRGAKLTRRHAPECVGREAQHAEAEPDRGRPRKGSGPGMHGPRRHA